MTRQPTATTFVGALTALVHSLRPSWDKAGIKAAIESAWDQYAPGLIAAAAVDAAITTSTHTPAGIGARLRDGWGSSSHGWTKDQIDAAKPLTRPAPYPRCQCCDLDILTHAGETRENHQCPPYVTDRETGEQIEHHCKRQPERGQKVDLGSVREQLAAANAKHEQAVKAAMVAEGKR